MTLEQYNRAKEIENELMQIKNQLPVLIQRVARFNDYLHLMDGRIPAPQYAGKIVKKVELKINTDAIEIDLRDRFDMVEDNKKEFVDFLKKCQANYQKQIEKLGARKQELEEEFGKL